MRTGKSTRSTDIEHLLNIRSGFLYKLLILLALPTGVEPVFQP